LRVAIITGGGSGIGQAVARALARDGFAVVLAGRRAAVLEASANRINAEGGQALAVPADITNPASVAALFDCVRSQFGRLDLLFNNAGVGTPAVPLEQITVEQWMTVIATNLTGAFLCTRAAFRVMKDQNPRGGRIINNGSISAAAPRPGSAPYTAAKHGITGLTRSTSLDGRKYDIACGQIDIGNAATDMTEPIAEGVPQADGRVIAEPRMDVAHVSIAVAYMASLPLDANVQYMTVMATKMPFIGRG
jgi:NAD(P)-dependent dehydrogenase (short-subunit alcohol dehydrogenase family)